MFSVPGKRSPRLEVLTRPSAPDEALPLLLLCDGTSSVAVFFEIRSREEVASYPSLRFWTDEGDRLEGG